MDIANVHATCVMLARAGDSFSLHRAGVLLLGASGSGKSDLALRLIERGALLVSDDRTELFVRDEKLFARAPAALAGLLEIRGAGIIELSYEREAQISLAVELADSVPRLPEPQRYAPPAPLVLRQAACPPLLRLRALEASAPAKVIWSAAAFAGNLFRQDVKKI